MRLLGRKPFQKMKTIKRNAVKHLQALPIACFLFKNRRAVSAVISNMILIAAVIIAGFVALSFAMANSANYQTQYQQTVNSDISKLKESISFEYVFYNYTASALKVYFINSGQTSLTIDKVFLSNSAQNISFSMYYKNGQSAPSHTLSAGQEGYIVANTGLTSNLYQVKLTTGRNSNFEYNFVA